MSSELLLDSAIGENYEFFELPTYSSEPAGDHLDPDGCVAVADLNGVLAGLVRLPASRAENKVER